MPKYIVGEMPIHHDGQKYIEGELIELTPKEAKEFGLTEAPKSSGGAGGGDDKLLRKLKEEADELGIQYAPSIGAETLSKKIAAKKEEGNK